MRPSLVAVVIAVVSGNPQIGTLNATEACRVRPKAGSGLVGAWRLVSFESRTANAEIRHPLCPSPRG
jgi:hypothetical protein